MTNGPVAAEELRLLVERVERLEEEKKGIADDIKDVYGEAKSRGFCAKTIKRIVRERKKTLDQRREEEAMFDLYRGALGMLDGTPLGNWAVEKLTKPKGAAPNAGQPDDGKGASSAGGDQGNGASATEDNAAAGAAGSHDDASVTIGQARQQGTEAARQGKPVTANPFPPRSPLRAAWDEAWCHELGSDGMDIPAALRPAAKPKAAPGAAKDEGAAEAEDDASQDDETVGGSAGGHEGEPEGEDPAAVELESTASADPNGRGAHDPVYAQARETVIREQYASTSRIQRAFSIGYNRAARIVEALEAEGVISSPDEFGKRDLLLDEKGNRK